jgi:hypothetical protein
MNDRERIVHHKKAVASKYGTQERLKTSDEQEKLTPELLEMSGVNLAFSKKGLEKVGWIGISDARLDGTRRVANFRSLFLADGTCGS